MTPGERVVLVAIADHLRDYGWPPTIDELCSRLGLASKSTVHGRLVSLERQGLIVRAPGPRAIRLVGDLDVAELVAHARAGATDPAGAGR